MKRRHFLFGLTATSATLWAGASMAAAYADGVVAQLTKQGYFNISVETTWLGRVRIVADRADGEREIILNPRTGEILRDTWRGNGADGVTPIIDEVDSSGNGSASGGDDGGSGSGSDGPGSGGSDGSGGVDSGGGDSGGDDHGGSGGGGGNGGDDHGGGSGHGGSDDSHGGGGNDDDNGGKGN